MLIGYYKDAEHLKWILDKKLYNVRAGRDRGSLDLSSDVCSAQYMLLYGKEGIYKLRLRPNCVRVWSKDELEKCGYEKPRHDFYLMFFIEELLEEGEFVQMQFDKDKLKALLNRHGKDNANHDKGATAVSFSELVGCI